jgi:regulator of protease activity HflC (stomatin/prohibitin superfamily)
MVLLNTMVIVEPHQQAVKLSRGGVVGEEVHGSGLMLKLPWPLQTAEVYDVTRVRRLHLTSRDVREYPGTAEGLAQPKPRTHLWTQRLGQRYDKELDPFIVGIDAEAVGTPEDLISLVDAEIVLRYRIRADGGLLEWLRFSDRNISRSNRTPERIRALRAIALREVTRTMARLPFGSVLTSRRADLCVQLTERVQTALDDAQSGIEVVAIDLPLLQPAGELAGKFDEVSIGNEARREIVAKEEQLVAVALAQLAGSAESAAAIHAMLVEYDALQEAVEAPAQLEERRQRMLAAGLDDPPTEAEIAAARIAAQAAEPKLAPARLAIEDAVMTAGGAAASLIARAQRDRWVGLIEARTSTQRVASELASYLAAPRLYRERARMAVLTEAMSGQQNRYLFAVDPSRIDLRLDLTEINSQFNIADGIQQEEDLMKGGG